MAWLGASSGKAVKMKWIRARSAAIAPSVLTESGQQHGRSPQMHRKHAAFGTRSTNGPS